MDKVGLNTAPDKYLLSKMPKWKKTDTLYTVKTAHHPKRGTQVYLPKPIVEELGRPSQITFLIKEDKSVLLMPTKKAYVTKAVDTLEAHLRGKITRKEAGRILLDIATEPIVEEDEVLDDIFTNLILIDEPKAKGRLTSKEIKDLYRQLQTILKAS